MILCLALLVSVFAVAVNPTPAAAAAPTTSLTVTKYLADGTVLAQQTVTYQWMQSHLPVQGDNVTEYFLQSNATTPATYSSKGMVEGTDVKDLCNLVGGAQPGDLIQVAAADSFNPNMRFSYGNVYNPDPAMGKLAICWFTRNYNGTSYPSGAYVPTFSQGMLLVYLAADQHCTTAAFVADVPNRGTANNPNQGSQKTVNGINIFSQLRRITASAGANGSISPSGNVLVTNGTNQTFTITPAAGFQVNKVLVDGRSVGAVTSYTFTNVRANHTIAASFTAGPVLSSVTPNMGLRGRGMTVNITGKNLSRTTAVSFGDGITVKRFTASSTKITATITIAPNAHLGTRDISVTCGGVTITLTNAFIVL